MTTKNKFYQSIGKPIKNWKNLMTFSALIFICATCTPRNAVTGHIKGLTNDTVLVYVTSLEHIENQPVRDTIFAKNGRFEYNFPNDGAYGLNFTFPQFVEHRKIPGGVWHYNPNNSRFIVFVEPNEKIRIKGVTNLAGLDNIVVSGSKLNRDYSLIQNRMYEININEAKDEVALNQSFYDKDKEAEEIGMANRQERLNARMELLGNYVRENLNKPLSAFLLTHLPLDSVALIYDQLGENARNSIFSNLLNLQMKRYQEYTSVMKAKQEVVVGNKAPDFTLADMDGKPFSLSSLQGKYVIVDFWGSWCGPCIKGIPEMKSTYIKYKDKLEILGVACNEASVDVWKNAVKQHELPWQNVYNDKSSDVLVRYGIEGFPTKIVIDPEGTILIREIGEGKDFYTKLENSMN